MFSATSHLSKRKTSDLLVIPFWERQRKAKPAAALGVLSRLAKPPIDEGDFQGKLGELSLLYNGNGSGKEKRILLLGLGYEEAISVEKLRIAYANVAKECQRRAVRQIALLLPSITELRNFTVHECVEGIAEGILLTNYCWETLGTLEEETVLLKSIQLIGILPKMLDCIKTCEAIAEGVYFARDLINGNADTVTPSYLTAVARKLAQKFPAVKATIYDRERIEEEKMGLFTAVSRGSAEEPALIILSYKGHPRSKDHTVVIGKGVTFDTGGLQIKSAEGMMTMRYDMSGAAVALATVATAASLKLPVNVTAVIPTTENAIDALSFKPGDVYTAYDGTTVEICDTDAEGRLILADALAYTQKTLKPSRMIDIATLTGSIVTALGEGIAGLFSNDEQLTHSLKEASLRTHELLWEMPLPSSYKAALKSDIADLKNTGGRPGGAIRAALFLNHFVTNKIPWAHLDIAGTAFQSQELGYWPKQGVGFGVRLLIDFLRHLK